MNTEKRLPALDEVRRLARALLDQAQAAHQRRALVLAGEAGWCRAMAAGLCELPALARVSWITTQTVSGWEALPGARALSLLGQERDAIVFDAHSGFDPDVFGAVSGTVCGGGLLLLLTPPLERWADFADPAAERIAVAPLSFADVPGRFLRRLARVTGAAEGVHVVRQGEALAAVSPPASPAPGGENAYAGGDVRSADQQAAVAAVEHVVHGHRRRPAVLIADRGRGKSAALGIAAARLVRGGLRRIVVTAPRLDAVTPLFEQAGRLLPEAVSRRGRLQLGEASIEFHPPDELVLAPIAADLLLVDEAAAIPAPLLTRLLERYARIAFATTVHGYEGTGRGFAVRFRRTLDERTPGWREVCLRTPIRWAADDPVERYVFRALLLDAAAAADDEVAQASPDACDFVRLDRDALADDEATLAPLFGLLVLAHYRTRPNDLRNLLDGPGLSVYALRFRGRIVATALVAAEGGFSAGMAQAISEGRRRPRGHLIPQSLAAHVGLGEGARLRCARIMRIAVHPAARRRGLGATLLHGIHRQALADGHDLLGASFGASEELLAFWHNENLRPVRLGFSRDHASGSHSALVLRPLSAAGEAVYLPARRHFLAGFPVQLADPLRTLDPLLAACLLQGDASPAPHLAPDPRDLAEAAAFARGARSFEDGLAPLYRLGLWALADPANGLSAEARTVLVAKLLQKRSWGETAALLGVPGRAAVAERLRQTVGLILR